MTVLLVILAVIVVCWALATLASVLLLARRNRVAPRAKTGAPLHWLAAPSRAASAHRRLRRAVAGARAGLGGLPTDAAIHADVAACVDLLERQAVDLDHRLVVAARCPAATRWRLVNDLDPQVREVERIGSQLAEAAVMASPKPPGAGEGLDALNRRLRALADARAELDAMDDTPPAAQEPPSRAAGGPAAALPAGDARAPEPRPPAQERVAQRRAQPEG